jgi:hypothetical protein
MGNPFSQLISRQEINNLVRFQSCEPECAQILPEN